jgi:HD domain
MPAASLFADLLSVLTADRRAHSVAVGVKAASAADQVAPWLRSDLVAAATLHDIGYGHVVSGFHPLDGARFLTGAGFSAAVCHLVAHHTASTYEAEERGIDLAAYAEFPAVGNLGPAHAVLWWADLTTGPQGQDVTVEDRLAEILNRYGQDDPVGRFVINNRSLLLAAGQTATGSIQVRG